MSGETDALLEDLRAWGLRLPGAHGKAPRPEHEQLKQRVEQDYRAPALRN